MLMLFVSALAVRFGLLAFCLLLGLVLAVGAWRRANQRRRAARVLAGLVAAGGLWLSAFPPQHQMPAARNEAILLTPGYQPDTLRQLLRRLGAGTPVWRYGATAALAPARPLASLLTLAEQPGLRRLHVLGEGLSAAEMLVMSRLLVQPHAAPAFAGIRAAGWNQTLALGEELWVEGTAALPKGQLVWACLWAAGAVRDSARLPTGSGRFRLRYRPKTEGLDCYELLLRRAGQQVAREPLPVEVTRPRLPAVLLLAAAPSFEFKFLKNYLAEAHYPVALRTAVSRGVVQTEAVNQPASVPDRLTPAVLARYAVVVADAATLAACSAAEAQALQSSVRNGRLGLLVLADAAPLPRALPGRADFTVRPRPGPEAGPQRLAWPGAPADVRAPLPAQLRPSPALRALVTGPNQALAAARRREGTGFVVASVVPETFRWALQGRTSVYAAFWSHLLAAALPPGPAAATWRVGTRWPRPQQPLMLHLAAAGFPAFQPTVQAVADGRPVRLALRQDTRLPEWSTAQFWPAAPGWHRVRGPSRAGAIFYVFPTAAWQGPERQERQLAMTQRAGAVLTGPGGSTAGVALQPWPAAWFFWLFLLAGGFLWLEEKL